MIPALAVAIAVLGSPVGRAPEAAFLDGLARAAYARGDYREAFALFSEKQAAAPSTRNLYNMAVAAELSGRPELAYALWTRYRFAPEGDDEPKRRAHGRARQEALGAGLALLTVHTEPPGAQIFVDRRALGRHGESPITLSLAPGSHQIFAERALHRPASATVEVERRGHATLRLRLAPETGRLRIRTRPPTGVTLSRWAEDPDRGVDVPVGKTSTVPVGRWRIVARSPGYDDAEVSVSVRTDQLEARTLTLTPRAPPTGWLLVSAGAARATLFVDGQARAEIPARIAVSAGPREVSLRREGATLWTQRVEVEAGSSRVLWAALP